LPLALRSTAPNASPLLPWPDCTSSLPPRLPGIYEGYKRYFYNTYLATESVGKSSKVSSLCSA